MEMKECYKIFGGNYEDVKSRLMKDTLIERFVIKFLADNSFEQLTQALEEKNYEVAFRAIHTLKGVSQNLGFDRLSASASSLTEVLRMWGTTEIAAEECEALYNQVSADYKEVINTIKKWQESHSEA